MPHVPPTPIPVLVVNELTMLDALLQVVLPLLSLMVAATAAWAAIAAVGHAKKSDARAAASDARAEELVRAATRERFAGRLRDYARHLRDGYTPGMSVHTMTDPWRDALREAPDEAGQLLVTWIGRYFGDFNHAFRGQMLDQRDQELANFYGEVEARIRAWERHGESSDVEPLSKRGWPDPLVES